MSSRNHAILLGLALLMAVLGADCPGDSHFPIDECCETTFFYDAYRVGINVPADWPVASNGLIGGDNRIIGWYASADTANILNPDLEIRSRRDFRTLQQIENDLRDADLNLPATQREIEASTTLGGRPALLVVRASETKTVVSAYVKVGSTLYCASMVGKEASGTNDREFLVATCRSLCIGVDGR